MCRSTMGLRGNAPLTVQELVGILREAPEGLRLGRGTPKRRLDVFISLEPPVHHAPFVTFGFENKQVRPVLWQPREMKFHHLGGCF